MINSLRGKVLSVDTDSITLDVSGFGLEVFVTKSLLTGSAVVGEDLTCFAYLQISDAGLSLFGFSNERERALFMELLQVKTMGGKLSITLLRHLDTEEILAAIGAGNAAMLGVPGLGPKRAERICFELKDKLAKKFAGLPESGVAGARSVNLDVTVVDALTGLGFSQSESARAITMTKANAAPDTEWTEESLLMAALGLLQKR
ncbi:Holliday junction branch migration protein RuvA [Synergistaceae bacterium OttesenSCG-928-D05]|nr:Holliday junction branch migration protein RuvA [Synergistaceae bacterium OttesenSCG-928-D05]